MRKRAGTIARYRIQRTWSVNNSPSLKTRAALGTTDSFEFRVVFKTSMDTIKKRLRNVFVVVTCISRTAIRESPFLLGIKPDVIFCEKRAMVWTMKIDARRACPVTGHYYAKSSLRRVIRVVVGHCFATSVRSPDNSAIFDSENHCNPLCTIIQVPWIRWFLSGRMYHHLCYTTAVFTATLSMHTAEEDMSYTIHNLALYASVVLAKYTTN